MFIVIWMHITAPMKNGYYYHKWNRIDTKLVDFKDELFEKLPPFFWYAEHLRHKGAIASERFNR